MRVKNWKEKTGDMSAPPKWSKITWGINPTLSDSSVDHKAASFFFSLERYLRIYGSFLTAKKETNKHQRKSQWALHNHESPV